MNPLHLNIDNLNLQEGVGDDCDPIDVASIISKRLIECGAADGAVYVTDQPFEYVPPAIFVSETSTVGNTWEGFWETMITVSCVDIADYGALRLAHYVRKLLDGWGGNGLEDVNHVSTIPVRTTEVNPAIHTRTLTFRVVYQELP